MYNTFTYVLLISEEKRDIEIEREMAEESEKRFEAIMDKLFHAPSPRKSLTNSYPGNQMSRGVKRPNTAMYSSALGSTGNLIEASSNKSVARGSGQAPQCRPWDRGDLMKRLATFKSMTWFAKPQVVNAVNCARRGWINIDADTIACEACGARLFFSTPSTWMQHQVEKAALVFSLKLDNGHKLLCPWIDNACDETLAQFPPTQAEVLVDEYKKRFFALMHLLALPVISTSAINRMKSPLLKSFLVGNLDVGCSNESAGISSSEGLNNNIENMSSVSYHQAQKLISLCGWEPRVLSYIVDCKNQQNQSSGDGKSSDLSRGVSNAHNSSLLVYSSGKQATIGSNNDSMISEQYDPSSVVLDCRLCGASIGLWAFSTVLQPLELLRVVGYTNANGAHDDSANLKERAIGSEICATSTSATLSTERQSSLNLTIAGGPSPTKQNFKATISLPIVGRNLRARFSSDPNFRDHMRVKNLAAEGIKHGESTITGTSLQVEDMGSLRDKQVEEDPKTSAVFSVVEEPVRNSASLFDGSSKDDTVRENAENIDTTNAKVGASIISHVEECSMAATCDDLTLTNGKTVEGDDLMTVDANINILATPTVSAAAMESLDANGTKNTTQPLNDVQPTKRGENIDKMLSGQGMEFDPIGQHRTFCSWIGSVNNSVPGWQQVLSALHRQHEFSSPSDATDAPSSSLIEVDDPITSIRKLFTPPSAKRTKLVHHSS